MLDSYKLVSVTAINLLDLSIRHFTDTSFFSVNFSKFDLKTDENINIYDYAEYPKESDMPVIFRNWASTICAIKEDTSCHTNRMHKNIIGTKNIRKLVAVGTLKAPYCVRVK